MKVSKLLEQDGVGVWAASTDGVMSCDYAGAVIAHHVMTDANNMLSNEVLSLIIDSRQRVLVGGGRRSAGVKLRRNF